MQQLKSLLKIKHNEWPRYSNQIVNANTVLLKDIIHYMPHDYQPKFMCSTLFVEHCDKNWLYYHLTQQTFPLLQELFLNSHPDDQINRLLTDFPKVFLTKRYADSSRIQRYMPHKEISYKECDTSNTLQIISEIEYSRRLLEYN